MLRARKDNRVSALSALSEKVEARVGHRVAGEKCYVPRTTAG